MKFDSEKYLFCSVSSLLGTNQVDFISECIKPIKNICGGKIEGIQLGDIKQINVDNVKSIIFCPKSNGDIKIEEVKILFDDVDYYNYDPAILVKARLDNLDINLRIRKHINNCEYFISIINNNENDKNRGIYYIVLKFGVAEISYFDGEALKSIKSNFKLKEEMKKFISTEPSNLENIGFVADKKVKKSLYDFQPDKIVSDAFMNATKEKFDSWSETVFEENKCLCKKDNK